MSKKEEYLTSEEAAEKLGVSMPTLWRMIARGTLRKFKKPATGTRVYIPAEDVDKAKQYEET